MLGKTLAAAVAVSTLAVASTGAQAAVAYALTDTNTLLGFDTGTPSSVTSAVILKTAANTAIEDLIGIDFRPATSTLYGVGRFGTIYTINPTTGVATTVAALAAEPTDATSPFTGLSGTRFGFDFNPTVDRLRIISDADQNLRVNVTTGATITDGTINPGSATVIDAAYTNNFAGATTTTLYTIDSVTNQLMTQAPANDGTQVLVGSLGIDVTSISGFDIYTVNGVNTGFAALQTTFNPASSLYSINLATGFATPLGTIGGGDVIDGLAVVPAAVPEPTALVALAGAGLVALRRKRA